MLSQYAHLSPTHLWKAVEGLAQVGAVTEKTAADEDRQKVLKNLVSRLGLEPRALALKGRCSTD